jgi:hypothetical protein
MVDLGAITNFSHFAVSVRSASAAPPANNHYRSVAQQSFWQSGVVGNNAGNGQGPMPLAGSARCILRMFRR